jgi:hypothetical protein
MKRTVRENVVKRKARAPARRQHAPARRQHTPTRQRRVAFPRVRILLIAAAVAGAFVPLPPRVVEHVYSTGVYALLQPLVTSASNATPIALLDVTILAVIAVWLALAVRDVARGGGWRGAADVAVRSLVWCAGAYLLFLAAWGLNYRRVRLMDRLPFDASAVNEPSAVRLASIAVHRVNGLYATAHEDGWLTPHAIDPSLAGAFERARGELGLPRSFVVGRPKASWLDPYFTRTGVDGMTDPLWLETLVATDLLPFERPMVVAHEWSHLAGIADEGEANFAGWLTCVRGSIADQYSGWLFLYGELARALPPRERESLASVLAVGPRGDLAAVRDRVTRHLNPRVSAAGWRVYDSYLKANRVDAGTASYAEVIRLALGVRLATPF